MYEFAATVWRHDGQSAWHFLCLPDDVSDDIEAQQTVRIRGFGSVRVEAIIGRTTWRTSIFPDTKRRCYVLPVKKDVRARECLDGGAQAQVRLTVLG